MYELAKLPKNPAIARQLLNMADLGGLSVPANLYDLAIEDLVSLDDLSDFTLAPADIDLSVLQYMNDRNGRCVVLETRHKALPSIIARIWMYDLFPLLITADNSTSCVKWQTALEKAFPNKSISAGSPEELGHDVYIMHSTHIYDEEMLKKTRFKQVIIDFSYSQVTSTKQKSLSMLHNLAIETFSVTVVSNLRTLIHKNNNNINLTDSEILKLIDLDNRNKLIALWGNILYPRNTFAKIFNNEYERINEHISSKGYNLTKTNSLLSAMNICTVLIE